MATSNRILVMVALLLCAALFFAGCGGALPENLVDMSESSDNAAPAASAQTGAALALVTTESRFDTAFGQAVWQAMGRYAGEQGLQSAVYKAEDGDAEAALSTLSLVASGGAQVVIAMGESTSTACAKAAPTYPEMSFILLDLPAGQSPPHRATWVQPDPITLGWVAGYAAVADGMTELACLWDSSPDAPTGSRAWALGFVLGCQDAAKAGSARGEAAGVRVRVLGIAPQPGAAAPYAVTELLRQRPQLVVAAYESWPQVEGWFSASQGLRFLAPYCQEDVPAGRLWAMVELKPESLVPHLLAQWAARQLYEGQMVPAIAGGGAYLAAGLAGGTQETLDAPVQLLVPSREQALQRLAQEQLTQFPELAAADFPDINLVMLPRDAAPPRSAAATPDVPPPASEGHIPAPPDAAPAPPLPDAAPTEDAQGAGCPNNDCGIIPVG